MAFQLEGCFQVDHVAATYGSEASPSLRFGTPYVIIIIIIIINLFAIRNIMRVNTILLALAGHQRNKRSSCWCL